MHREWSAWRLQSEAKNLEIISAQGTITALMTIVEAEMTGVLMTEEDETTEIGEALGTTVAEAGQGMTVAEAIQGMTVAEAVQGMTEAAIAETEAITAAKMKTTPEMIGIVENVATLIFHSEQNAIVVGHQRDVAAEVHQNSGLETTEDLAIGTIPNNLVQEIGNVASANK